MYLHSFDDSGSFARTFASDSAVEPIIEYDSFHT